MLVSKLRVYQYARAQSTPNPNSINHSDISIIFVQPQNVSTLLSLSPKLPTLKTIVALGEVPEGARKIADAWGNGHGIRIFTLSEGDPPFVRAPCCGANWLSPSRGDRRKGTFATPAGNCGHDSDNLLYLCERLTAIPVARR